MSVDFNRVTVDANVVDGAVVRQDATLGDDQVAATYVSAELFPATIGEFIAYFDRLSSNAGAISMTLDPHGWYPAEGRIDPLPDAEDDEFSWTLTLEPS